MYTVQQCISYSQPSLTVDKKPKENNKKENGPSEKLGQGGENPFVMRESEEEEEKMEKEEEEGEKERRRRKWRRKWKRRKRTRRNK